MNAAVAHQSDAVGLPLFRGPPSLAVEEPGGQRSEGDAHEHGRHWLQVSHFCCVSFTRRGSNAQASPRYHRDLILTEMMPYSRMNAPNAVSYRDAMSLERHS